MLESTVAWIRGLSFPVSISGHTRLYTFIATSCLNSRGRERSVDPVMVRRFSRIGFKEMFTYISSPHRISNTRSLQEADDHHSAVLRQQLDVLLRVVAADEIENHIDASVAHLTNRTFTSSWSRP